MRFFEKCNGGGDAAPTDIYFLFEIKWLCSIAILKFKKGKSAPCHSHAFNALTWFIKGDLHEAFRDKKKAPYQYKRSVIPKITPRSNCHKITAKSDSWCFTIRGPWLDTWTEYDEETGTTTFTHGRKIVSHQPNKEPK